MITVYVKNGNNETIATSKHATQQIAEQWVLDNWPNNSVEYVDTTAQDVVNDTVGYAREAMRLGTEILAFIRAGNELANLTRVQIDAIYDNADVERCQRALKNGSLLYAKVLIQEMDISIFPDNAKAFLIGKIDAFLTANGKPTEF